jgi:hypothetical protein
MNCAFLWCGHENPGRNRSRHLRRDWEVVGAGVSSLPHDGSTTTGEEVIHVTLVEPLVVREAAKR